MLASNLTINDLLRATAGRLVTGTDRQAVREHITRVVIDSREVEPGDLFWALPGSRLDGSQFVTDAWAHGAAGAVTTCVPQVSPSDHFVIHVNDGLASLWKLAAYQRQRFSGTLIGVTGSVGKTTTRQMIDTVLCSRFHGVASRSNYNNHIGVPLSMLELGNHDYGVLELGASAPGEIAELARLCQPQIGVITTIAEAHLAGFGDRDKVACSKAELLAALPEHGLAIVNGDCRLLRRAAAAWHGRTIWFGRGADCDVVATAVAARRGWLRFRVQDQPFAVPVFGRHFLESALAAIAVGQAMNLSLADIAEALSGFESPAMRCELEHIGEFTVINDAYNACPTAMRAALELLRDYEVDGRRVVICGDMLELGADAPEFHRELGRHIVEVCGADALLACGSFAHIVAEEARRAGMPSGCIVACSSVDHVRSHLARRLQPGDTVLVKGSRAMRMERVVAWLREGEYSPEPHRFALPPELIAA